ncbi:MAG TPA: terminase small subunit [Thermodesulfobacteriota bacterium]|nr:terminase small subunit [Thermodesulfobacteriota bacterium]
MPKRRELSLKEKKFAIEYVKNKGNGTAAVKEVYDVKSNVNAAAQAYQKLLKPEIKEEITKILDDNGLDQQFIAQNLKQAIQSGIGERANNSDALRGIENLIKLHNLNPISKSARLNVSLNSGYDSKNYDELLIELRKSRETTEKLLKDLGSEGG